MSPEPWVAQTTSSTSCACEVGGGRGLVGDIDRVAGARRAPASAHRPPSGRCPIRCRPGSGSWPSPKGYGQHVPRCDATGWRGGARAACQSAGAWNETPVIAALEGGVLTLMLNRPQRLNAMSNALIEAMNHELARARDDGDDARRAADRDRPRLLRRRRPRGRRPRRSDGRRRSPISAPTWTASSTP